MSDTMPALLSRKNARLAAGAVAGLRVLIGAVAVVVPRLALTPWIGREDAATSGAKLLGRSVGARDLGLGAGALLAMRHDTPVRGWVEAGALSDVGDAVASVIAFPRLAPKTRWGVLVMTLVAVAAGMLMAPCVDRSEDDGADD